MTRVALLRHFPTAWNAERRLQGQVDVPLTEAARARLAGLALPAPWDAARLVASPLGRAHETARLLAGGRPFDTDARFTEMSWGDWEGMLVDALIADPASGYVHVEEWGWHRRPPGGESPWEVWERVRPALAEIAAAGRPAVIVGHRPAMRVILARAWGWNYDAPEPFRIRRARLYPLTLMPDGTPTAPGEPVALAER
jgi:probable phosphoglycerate mutase